MPTDNPARTRAMALQAMAAHEYGFARTISHLAYADGRHADAAKRYQELASTVAAEARAALDRHLVQTPTAA